MKKFIYRAYTRVINERTHYFVKKYEAYSDVPGISPILIGLGMNVDFLKACELARVESDVAVQKMMDALQLTNVSGRILPVSYVQTLKRSEKSVPFWDPQYWLSKLKWAHI